MSFVYIWEYRVDPANRQAFRRAYGSNGDWAEFFRRSEHYRKTELFQDADDTSRFLTIDHWTSKSARNAFVESHRDTFDELDAAYERLTLEERWLGDFDVV